MRAVIQRVTNANLKVENKLISQINHGLVCYLGIKGNDDDSQLDWLAKKVAGLRIFNDENNKMNLSLKDVKGEILVVSQFTLYGNVKKGYRPSFIQAQKPETAEALYDNFCTLLSEKLEKNVATGIFGADMQIQQVNDGPVTIIIDTEE